MPSRARSRSARAARFSCDGPVERAGLRRDNLLAALARLLVLGHLQRARRRGLVGAVLSEQRLDLDAVLLDGAGLELLDPQPLLGAGDLVAMHRVGQPCQLLGELASAAAHGQQLALADRPSLLRVVTLGRRAFDGRGDLDEHLPGDVADRGGNDGTARAGLASELLAATRRALDLGGPHQLVGTAGQGTHPLLAGAHREPGLHLGLPGRGDPRCSASRSSVAGS